jgi:hypothetical protein
LNVGCSLDGKRFAICVSSAHFCSFFKLTPPVSANNSSNSASVRACSARTAQPRHSTSGAVRYGGSRGPCNATRTTCSRRTAPMTARRRRCGSSDQAC